MRREHLCSILAIFISFLFLQALFKSSTFMSYITIELTVTVFMKNAHPAYFFRSVLEFNPKYVQNNCTYYL